MLGSHRSHPASWAILREHLSTSCRRASTSHAPGRILTGERLGPTHADLHQTWRIRRNEQLEGLPIPPLLDPVVLERRSRWEQTKERPKAAEFTPFQKKLHANPFAHALASPVRQCRMTLISLPSAFLTTLHARPHPTTNDPWLLPVSLTTDTKQLGPPFYFLGNRAIVAQLGKKKAWQHTLGPRVRQKLAGHGLTRMVWREDMPDFILQTMRKWLVKKLSWNFGFRGRLIPVASPRMKDLDQLEAVSSVIIFRSLINRGDQAQTDAEAIQFELDKWSSYFAKSFAAKIDPHAAPHITHHAPSWYTEPLVTRLQPRLRFPELEFKTCVWRGTRVPLYSLHDMLGEEVATALIQDSEYSTASCVVLKTARHNVPVEILLMQLQAYSTRSGP